MQAAKNLAAVEPLYGLIGICMKSRGKNSRTWGNSLIKIFAEIMYVVRKNRKYKVTGFVMPTFVKLLTAGFLSISGCIALAEEYEVVPVDMTPIQVSRHAYYVQGGTGVATDNYDFVSNSTFVVTGEGVILFDTLGTPAL